MWQQIRSNHRRSLTLVLVMALVLISAGIAVGEFYFFDVAGHFGGIAGGAFAFFVWLALALASYYSGDKFILSTSGASRVTHDDFPELFNVVEEMKIASGCARVPNVYIIPDSSPNAFATGRNPESASVAVTSGLLAKLNRNELQGVIAHEMSHIMNRDVMLMTMLGTMLGAVVIISDTFFRARFGRGVGRRASSGGGQAQLVIFVIALVFIILAPFLAQIIYFAISRKREYLADACAVQYTRYPEGLAAALENISGAPQKVQKANRATAPMYIVNPFSGLKKSVADLNSTHPPIKNRIRILRGMAGNYSLDAYQGKWRDVIGGRQNLFSAGDLSAPAFAPAGAAALAQQESQVPAEPVVNRSEISDFLWEKEGYGIIDCDCGVRLKLPPNFHAKTFRCPKCRKKHELDASKLAV